MAVVITTAIIICPHYLLLKSYIYLYSAINLKVHVSILTKAAEDVVPGSEGVESETRLKRAEE